MLKSFRPGLRLSCTLLHYSAPPIVGGVESVLAQHARLLAHAGHRVQVIAGRGAPFDERVRFTSLPLVDSRHPDVLEAKAGLDGGCVPEVFGRLLAALIVQLRDALADTDVLIAHNVCSLHKNLALTAALYELQRLRQIPPLVLWHHDLAWTAPRYRPELHAGYPWDLLRTHWGARHVAVSEYRRAELAQLLGPPAETIEVIPNGVEPEALLKLEPETRALARKLNLQQAAPILLLPVRLTPRKNIELALRILAELRHSLPAAALIVTGPLGAHNPANSAYAARLRALRDELGLQGAAHFLLDEYPAPVPGAMMADLYRMADALLLPSREEGFGLPVIEAALYRLPLFCADIPALRELAGDHAAYFSPDAAPAGVAALVAARLQSDARYRMAVRVRQEYAWNQVYARRIEPLLLSVCQPHVPQIGDLA